MAKGTRPHSRCGKPYRIEILQSTSVFCGMTEILAMQAPCGRCRTRFVLISSVLKKDFVRFCGMTEILAVQAPCGRCRTRIVLISSVLKKGLRPFLRNDRDSNSGNAFDVYTLSRRASSATRASFLLWGTKVGVLAELCKACLEIL